MHKIQSIWANIMSKHHPEGNMVTARNQNLRGTSFKLTPCKLVRDGDSQDKCMVNVCKPLTNQDESLEMNPYRIGT